VKLLHKNRSSGMEPSCFLFQRYSPTCTPSRENQSVSFQSTNIEQDLQLLKKLLQKIQEEIPRELENIKAEHINGLQLHQQSQKSLISASLTRKERRRYFFRSSSAERGKSRRWMLAPAMA
jgi:hypothetical protein